MSDQTTEQPESQDKSDVYNGDFLLGSNIILALAIFSIAGSWLYGLPGLCAGIVSLVFSNKVIRLKNELEDAADSKNLRKVKNARIFAIAGIFLSGLYLLALVVKFFVFKTA